MSDAGIAKVEERQSLGKRNDIEDVEATVPVTAWHRVAFCIMGFSDLYYWNSLLNILDSLRMEIYADYPSISETLNATNMLSSVVVCAICVWSGGMNHKVTLLAGWWIAITCTITGIVCQWSGGKTGVILLNLVQLIAGSSSGFYQTGAIALASVIDTELNGYVSAGAGINGVVTWLMWYGLSRTSITTMAKLWTLMAIGFVIAAFAAITFQMIAKEPQIAARSEIVRDALRTEKENPDAPSYRYLMVRCWKPLFGVFWNMFVTLYLFPNIGPLNWGSGETWITAVIGAFQIGDLIGRYLPCYVPGLQFSVKTAVFISLARTIVVPLGIMSWKYPNHGFWGNNYWHLCLMAFTALSNGWNVSCIYIATPNEIPHENWRSRVGSLMVLMTLTGIATGLWMVKFTFLSWISV